MNSLNDTLDRYDRLWRESKQQPVLGQFLEQVSLPDEQRLAALLELIAIDMEYRWRSEPAPDESSQTDTAKVAAASAEDTATELSGSRPLIEDYARQWPEILKDDEIPTDLVAEEFRIRHRWGDRPTIEDYVDRFGGDTTLRQELEATHRELQRDESDHEPPTPAVGPAFATLESSDSSDTAAESIMFGRYRLIRQLGKGGMGDVYLAEDTQLERRIALKTPHLGQGDALQKRFVNEAKAAATLHHPGICPVFDAGEIDDQPFITMAYIDGDTLREHWERFEDQSTLETVRIFADIARAMQVAHEAGIVHRDLKPSNVMLNSGGQPVVMDFGLAFRESIAEGERITQTGDAFGSPAYMSPEQVEDVAASVGPASDIYSLGVVLFEALTGRLPFAGSVSSILVQIARDTPPLPSQIRADINPELEQLCLQMLAKDRADRPASMTEVAERLTAIGKQLSADAASQTPSASMKPRGGNRVLIAAALAPIVLLLGLIVLSVKTPYGPLRIEVAEEFADQIKVRVLQQGKLVEIADNESGWSLSLEEGEYEFELGKGGEQFEIEPRRVTVSRENEAVVSVSFLTTSIPETSVPNTPNDASSTGHQDDFALSFDGKDDYVQLPFGYDGSHPLTVEGWVTPVTLNTNRMRQMIVADEASGVLGERTGLQFGIHNDLDWARTKAARYSAGKWWFAGGVKNPTMVILHSSRVKLNAPVHFAVQVVPKASEFEVFISGSSVDHQQRNELFASSGRDFRIGRDYTTEYEPGKFIDEPFKGLIHTVRFSKRLRYNGEFTPQRRFDSDDQTLALYQFDEGNGFTLKDSSGNGHDGEIHGAKWKGGTAPARSEVPGNFALSFDGIDDHVVTPVVYDGSHPITLEAWVSPADPYGTGRVISNDEVTAKGIGLGQRFIPAHQVRKWFASVRDRSKNPNWVEPQIDGMGMNQRRLHVAVCWNKEHLNLFVNGRQQGKYFSNELLAMPAVDLPFLIGSCYRSGQPAQGSAHRFFGEIDEVRISKVARYTGRDFTPLERFEPDDETLALYHFDETSGDAVLDSSPYRNHARIVGAKRVREFVMYQPSSYAARMEKFRKETTRPVLRRSGPALKSAGIENIASSSSLDIDSTKPFTIETWFTPLEPKIRANRAIVGFGGFRISVADGFSAGILRAGRRVVAVSGPTGHVEYGKRTHVVGQWTGQEFELFVNGRRSPALPHTYDSGKVAWERNSDFIQRELQESRQEPFEIGMRGDADYSMKVDRVRLSRGIRYSGEFEPEDFESDDNTVLLYDFHEGQGDVLHDVSGNGNDAKITGGEWLAAPSAPEDDGYVDLFDGKTLDGWEAEGDTQWAIEDGVLVSKRDDKWKRLVYTKAEFTDARVRVECKLGKGGNSGVHLRTHFGKVFGDGYEAQITNDKDPKQRTLIGGILDLAVVREQLVESDTWFTLEFEAKGNRLTVWVNGEKTAEATDATFKSGQIALQASNKAPVWFRKVQVKPLD